jgi:hypothetical protein
MSVGPENRNSRGFRGPRVAATACGPDHELSHRRRHRLRRAVCVTFAALFPSLVLAANAPACCIGIHLQPPVHAGTPPLAIGDSVLLGAAHQVARQGYEVDAREGRFMRHALRILRHLRRDHRHPPLIVIAIGTNTPPTTDELRRALHLIGRHQTLAFVTPLRSWSVLPDPAAWAFHRRHPRRVRILDWATYAAGHDSWFYADGTHLRPSGAVAYAQLLGSLLHFVGVMGREGFEPSSDGL